jgi:hypothetical protein
LEEALSIKEKSANFEKKKTHSNLPTYFLSIFHISVGVPNSLEKLQRDLLWGVLVMSLSFI